DAVAMKLETLTLENFRGFRSFQISFDPSFTVLLGSNMAGKSAVLEGAAIALGVLVSPALRRPIRDIENSEVRCNVVDVGGVPDLQRQFPITIEARAVTEGNTLHLQRRRPASESFTIQEGPGNNILKLSLSNNNPADLPVIAQYGTQRVWQGNETVED